MNCEVWGYEKGMVLETDKNTDISFCVDGGKFNFRVSCVILAESGRKVLLHRKKSDAFWNLIGGRTAMGESSAEAIQREIREEIGCNCHIRQLLSVAENFFCVSGKPYHEMLMTFSGELTEPIDPANIESDMEIRWFDPDQIDAIAIQPEFSKTIIQEACRNPNSVLPVRWIINNDIPTQEA